MKFKYLFNFGINQRTYRHWTKPMYHSSGKIWFQQNYKSWRMPASTGYIYIHIYIFLFVNN